MRARSSDRVMRRRAGIFLAAMCALAAPARAGTFGVEVAGMVGGPVDPQFFSDAWGRGLGIGGGLLYDMGRVAALVQGDFAQFSFEGSEELGTFGGERRFSSLTLALRLVLWKHDSLREESLSLAASAGWGHEAIAGIAGVEPGSKAAASLGDGSEDGVVWTAAAEFSRSLYRTTRWAAGLRYTRFEFEVESPAHVMLVFALRMPLAGSRPSS